MPVVTKWPAGSPCWFELTTTDIPGAIRFYTNLLGWTEVSSEMAPGQIYVVFKMNGRDVAAAHGMMPGQAEAGVHPNWMTYFSTESADETARRILDLGGAVDFGPVDAHDIGRLAIARDPLGAHFAVWQAGKHAGFELTGETGTVAWTELATPDSARAKEFYTNLFGWNTHSGPSAAIEYTYLGNAGRDFGGILKMGKECEGVPSHWMNYLHVPDCEGIAKRASELGGSICVPPHPIPSVGTFSVLTDPQGAAFSIIAFAPRTEPAAA